MVAGRDFGRDRIIEVEYIEVYCIWKLLRANISEPLQWLACERTPTHPLQYTS